MSSSAHVEAFARALGELKRRSGRSYRTLGERTGLSRSALHRYCQGRAVPEHFELVARIARACGATKAELVELHRRWAMATSETTASQDEPVARQLPAPPAGFTGRERELAHVTAALTAQPAAVVISALSGAGGIGKTWLALHWAHRNLHLFPDGQLHVDLRGFDPTCSPVPPAAALRGFLEAMGVDPATMPGDPQAQAGLYRSVIAGRRMLIVLDNARDTAQVVPLLPGSPTCTVLITSRRRLTRLVTAHGARQVDLDVLPDDEARNLLDRHLGPDRLASAPGAVDELVAFCAGLPLALGIVAARATSHPEFSLAALADELRDHAGRLDALNIDDAEANLRAVFSWSYQALAEPTATAFGLLGLAPGRDIGLPAAAALIGVPTAEARVRLRDLEAESLVQEHEPGRYRMHDLVRLYAAEQATRDIAEPVRHEALTRLLDFYLHTAYSGERVLDPHRPPIVIGRPVPGVTPHPLPDLARAVAWFEVEHANLMEAQLLAARHGWHTPTWRLGWVLHTFHYRQGHRRDNLATWRTAVAAVEHLDDPGDRARAHRRLGVALLDVGEHREGLANLNRALDLFHRADDVAGQARTHEAFAAAWHQQGDSERALKHAYQALELYQGLGDPTREANMLNSVGWYHVGLGDLTRAAEYCTAALELNRRQGYADGEAYTLSSVGHIAHRTGDHARAVEHFREAIAVLRSLNDRGEEADTLDLLAQAHSALGQHDEAREAWSQALELYRSQHRTAEVLAIRSRLAAPDTVA
ncbi:tetratricopeptide repeat protein [Actinosynnema sp. NPDC050801]|uniref:ATP-binding protein n=1 Tax=unclassified Actinosynnema TaxID=2637065 RepID=UPI0033F8AC37